MTGEKSDLLGIVQEIRVDLVLHPVHVVALVNTYEKAYDMVLQTLIIEFLKMTEIAEEVMNFIMRVMENLERGNSSGRENPKYSPISWGCSI